MFDGFEQVKDQQSRKRWFASTGMSVVIVIVLGVVGVVLAKTSSAPKAPEQEIDVTFHAAEEEEKKPPPPPPPPPVAADKPKPKRVGKVAPVQPKVMPEQRPREAEPTGPRAEMPDEILEFGDGEELGGDVKKTEVPVPVPLPLPVADDREEEIDDPDPISEKDPDFLVARPRSSNVQPTYPEKMRHQGVEAEVVLRVKISASGEVTKVDLVRGEEPFATAAITAVKTWRYEPATDAGKPVPSTRLVKIPFLLHGQR